MKKALVLILAFMLVSCTRAPDEIENSSSASMADKASSSTVSSEALSDEDKAAISQILQTEIYLYEQGCYGMEYEEGKEYKESYNLPRFARVFCQLHDEEDDGQKLIKAATKAYFDIDIDEIECVSGVLLEERRVIVNLTEIAIEGDIAQIKAEIYMNEIKIYDTCYTFYKSAFPENLRNTIFEGLSYDNSIWKIKSVKIEKPKPINEIININNLEDFMDFSSKLSEGDPAYVNGKFVLTNDIDLSSLDYFYSLGNKNGYSVIYELNSANFLSPLGFNGNFDGQGHTISGFNIECAADTLGFFSVINENAVIKNLNLKGNVINTDDAKHFNLCTGGFAGIVSPNAVIENCSFTGNVEGRAYTGGFIGQIKYTGSNKHYDKDGYEVGGSGYVKDCSFSGNVICANYSGGFVGSSIGYIEECKSEGNVIIDKKFGGIPIGVGGFAGEIWYNTEKCHCATKVQHYVKGANRMGNFTGCLGNHPILNCTIDENIINPEWYMVGNKDFRNTEVQIEKIGN